jgi:hypothetical protein
MSRDDQLRRRADAEALLRHPSWTSDEIDHAVALHDLLESPDLPPDPVLVSLRSRLAVDLRRRSERSASAMDITRAGIFSLGWLDSPDPFTHRLAVLYYQGHTSFMNFQTGVTAPC